MSQSPAATIQAKPISVAFMLGASDAGAGELCLPELFFVKREPILAYVRGFEFVAGETPLSRQMKDICAGNVHSVNW